MAQPGGHFSITTKLILTILIVALVPVGFLGWRAFEMQKLVIREEVTRSHLELSNMLARGIYENLEYTRRLLKTISALDVVRSLDPVVAEDFFNKLVQYFPFFKRIFLVNSKRQIIATTDPSVILPGDWLFTDVIKRSYQGSLSEVFPASESGGSPFMTLESVIRNPDKGSILGVVIAEVDLEYIHKLLRNALRKSKSQGLVLDDKGSIIALSSNEVRTMQLPSAQAQDTDIIDLKSIGGERFLITAVSLKKLDHYQAPNWTIVLQIPEHIAFEAAYRLRDSIIALLAGTAVFAVIMAIFLGYTLSSPLIYLMKGARHIGKGDFSHALVSHSSDEIGELTRTFDEMRVNLKSTKADLDYRILQLSTLYEVGKAISSVLDFNMLQRMILEIVVKVMQAEKGSLMLLDDAERILSIGVAFGLSDEITKETRVGLGEPVAGWVIESGLPLFVKDVESDHAFLAIKKEKIMKGTLMCVPMKAKDKILGVLNVSRSIPNSFTERDFELFKNLANQGAIAIENARLYRYAVTDEMTKLYNHRYFQQRLDEELQRADRYDSRISLIILDVDHFKKFNDTYGHPEGDRALKTVSRLIESNVREVDIPARYGGEEFVVICPEKDGEGSVVPANRIRTAIESYDFRIAGERVPITISLGIACYPDNARSKSELIVCADTALYYSKENGRNQASLYNSSMSAEKLIQYKEQKLKAVT